MREILTRKTRPFCIAVAIGMFAIAGPVQATQNSESEPKYYTRILDSFFDPVANDGGGLNIENFDPYKDSLLTEEDARLTERLNRLKDWLRTAGIKRIESAKKEKERLQKKREQEERENRLSYLKNMSVRKFRTKNEELLHKSNFELPQLSGDIVNQLNEIYKGPISRTGSNKGVRQILSFYTDQSGQSPLFPRDYDEQILSRIPEKELEKLEEDDALSNLLSGKTLHKRLLTDKPWALRLLSEHVRRKPTLKKQLLQLVEASKTCRSEFAANAAANAMSILNMADFSFSGMDLRNINAPGAMLEDSVMDGADLRNANLPGALLGRASLNQVRFDGANLSGVRFDERIFSKIGDNSLFSRDGNLLINLSYSPDRIQLLNVKSGTLLRSFKGDIGYRYNVVLSPNNHWLANVNDDGKVQVWNVESGKEIRKFHRPAAFVNNVVFSPCNKWLASAGDDAMVRLWHVESGEEIRKFKGHTTFVNSVVFSPDSKWLASGSNDRTVRLWHVESGKEIHKFKGRADSVNSVVFSPNNKWLASAGDDATVRLWNVETGEEIRKFQGHVNCIESIVFSPDNKWLASAGDDTTVRLWNVKTGEEIRKLDAVFVNSVMFSPNSKWLAMHTGTHIKLCNVKNKDRLCFSYGVKSLNLRNSPVTFSPDGDLLMQADVSNFDHRLRIVSVTPGHQKLKTNFTEPVEELFFSKDNRRLIGIGRKSKRGVRVINSWSTINGQQTEKKDLRHNKLSISHDENLLAVSKGKDLALMNRETQKIQITLRGHRRAISKIGFSPSDQYLASVDPNMAHVWDVKSGEKICTINKQISVLSDIIFSDDEQHLAIIGDYRLWLWNLKSCKKSREIPLESRVSSVAFSPNNKWLVGAGDDCTVRVWDMESGEEIKEFHLYDKVNSVAFSPNNKWLASTGGKGKMWLWDVKTGKKIQRFQGHTGNVNSVVFSPNSQWLASAGGEKFSYLSATSGDKMVHMFKFNPKSGKFDVQWIQGQPVLSANGADFRHAKGLTEPQRHLIKQYGGLVDEKVKDIDDWIETEKDDDDEKEAEMEDVG